MIIEAWRIVKQRYAHTAFSGEGARMRGGRWNNPGTAMVYTSSSVSLAMLETLVHLAPKVLGNYLVAKVKFDKRLVLSMAAGDLPPNWKDHKAPLEIKWIGDQWIAEQRSAVLEVPSAVNSLETNYLLNPMHGDYHKVLIGEFEPCPFDERLVD